MFKTAWELFSEYWLLIFGAAIAFAFVLIGLNLLYNEALFQIEKRRLNKRVSN